MRRLVQSLLCVLILVKGCITEGKTHGSCVMVGEEFHQKLVEENGQKTESPCLCQEKCSMLIECTSWTWEIPPISLCYLKKGYLDSKKTIKKRNIISGPTNCTDFYRKGKGLGKENVLCQNETQSAEKCQELCNHIESCKIFNWNQKSKLCFPRSAFTSMAPLDNEDAVIGARNCSLVNEIWENLLDKYPQDSRYKGPKSNALCEDILKTTLAQSDTPTSSTSTSLSISTEVPQGRSNEEILKRKEDDDDDDSKKEEAHMSISQEDNIQKSSKNYETIALSIGGILVFAVIFLLIGIFIFRKSKQQNSRHNTDHQQLSTRFESNIVIHKPIQVSELSNAVLCGELPKKKEFEELNHADSRKHTFTFSTDVGRKYTSPSYGSMNRYGNIIPYDHNRVILEKAIEDIDYFNASWIETFTEIPNMPMFIASQGPQKHTIPHFLQMLCENDVSAIVMLTNLRENGYGGIQQEKCSQYWPNVESETFRHMSVKLNFVTEPKARNVIIRNLEIKDRESEKILKSVQQFHFTAWPDHGVAGCAQNVIALIKMVQDYIKHLPDHAKSRICVHCSAGVGRTGTFIALYKLIEKLDQGIIQDTIDIYNEVFELRKNRCCMVQHQEQYAFLYQCIAFYLTGNDQELSNDYIYSLYNE